jgi:hypothetical protein
LLHHSSSLQHHSFLILAQDLGALHHYCTDVPAGGVGGQCSADYRGWSGAFWFQNTRHSYWPRLADADYDAMEPWFDMFVDILPLAEERSQVGTRHSGA